MAFTIFYDRLYGYEYLLISKENKLVLVLMLHSTYKILYYWLL